MPAIAAPSLGIGSEEFRGLLLRFRGRTRLSQAQLAARASVHLRSVQGWESGVSLPSTDKLQALIVALLDTGGFTPDAAEREARALWSAVEHASSRQHPPFDARWFAEKQAGGSPPLEVMVDQDWADAPDTSGFLGRKVELESLRRVVVQQRAGLVVLAGMGGIGKTRLAARLAREIAPRFRACHWRSVRNLPSFRDWSTSAIGFITQHQGVAPETDRARIEMLVELLRARRCLLVLDNLDVLIQPGRTDGAFYPEYQAYGDFLEAVASRSHESCVVLTTREVPAALAQLGVPVVELGGIEVEDARAILRDKSLDGDDCAWSDLVERFDGNGLVLRVVGDSIRQLFNGDIGEFMQQIPTGTIVGGIRRLLDSQFDRLSSIEVDIVCFLADAPEALSFSEITAEFVPHTSLSNVLEAIESLRHRSFIKSGGPSHGFTLRSVVREYATSELDVSDQPATLLARVA
jgi:transcriptional regulator with XRE-family HTH domain